MADLLNCPFCGTEPYSHYIPPHKHFLCNMPDHEGSGYVECPGCGAGISGSTEEEAIELWNTRVGLSTDAKNLFRRLLKGEMKSLYRGFLKNGDRIRELEEQVTAIQTLTGASLQQLIVYLKAGYTLEPPQPSMSMEEFARLLEEDQT